MKKTLLNFSVSLFIILIQIISLILIISLLTFNKIITYNLGEMIMTFSSIIAFFLFAFIYGKKQKHHGLIHGVLLIILYLAISILALNKFQVNILIKITKCLCLLFGTLIGVNFSSN